VFFFLQKRGGSDNASTDCEYTTFYFECQDRHLSQAIDKFSQFFVSPLMKREAMTREREAIESGKGSS
jgi:nardilysin